MNEDVFSIEKWRFSNVMLVFRGVLGGASKYFCIYTPGEMIQFDEHIFQMGGSTTN